MGKMVVCFCQPVLAAKGRCAHCAIEHRMSASDAALNWRCLALLVCVTVESVRL